MGKPLKHDVETLTEAHLLFSRGMSQTAIAAKLAVPLSTLRYHLKKPLSELAAPRRPVLRRGLDPESRPLLIARLWTTAERQVAEIEGRLVEAGGDPASLERDAKTLSILARTIRDLMALDEAAKPKPDKDDGETSPPRDLDAFRRVLAEKLIELGRLERGD
jgi:hypothetical protein